MSSVGYYALTYNNSSSAYLYFTPRLSLDTPVTITATGQTRQAKVEQIIVPAGTYYPGQRIPITVVLDYPVKASDIDLVVNGAEVAKITDASC